MAASLKSGMKNEDLKTHNYVTFKVILSTFLLLDRSVQQREMKEKSRVSHGEDIWSEITHAPTSPSGNKTANWKPSEH